MKRTNKFSAILALVLVFAVICAIGIGAESAATDGLGGASAVDAENTGVQQPNTATDASGENGMQESDTAPNTGGDGEAAEYDSESDADPTAENAGEVNVFKSIYDAVKENSAQIASIAAAVCSVILAFVMSRGLTPMLKDALGGIARVAGKLGEDVRESEKHAAVVTDALTERLALAEATVERLTGVVEALSEKSAHDGEEQLMREDILTVMSAQVELLYDLFMSSALPEYKKDTVGQRVSLMRHKLMPAGAKQDEA